jgi:hypothetical protein
VALVAQKLFYHLIATKLSFLKTSSATATSKPFLAGIGESMHLKPITKLFLAGKLLDVASTVVGLSLVAGMVELNPAQSSVAPLVAGNVAAVAVVSVTLERVRKWPKLVWIVPALVWLTVAWNVLNIVTCL